MVLFASSFASVPSHSLSDTGKMKKKVHKMKKMKDTGSKKMDKM